MLLIQTGGAATVGMLLTPSTADRRRSSRPLFSSLGLSALELPRWRSFEQAARRDIGVLGVVMATQNFVSLVALDRLPLGVMVTIAFLGPLGLAVSRSPSGQTLVWPALAVVGVFLLVDPLGGGPTDPIGITAACGSAVCWTLYIVLGAARSGAARRRRPNRRAGDRDGALVAVGLLEAGRRDVSIVVHRIP